MFVPTEADRARRVALRGGPAARGGGGDDDDGDDLGDPWRSVAVDVPRARAPGVAGPREPRGPRGVRAAVSASQLRLALQVPAASARRRGPGARRPRATPAGTAGAMRDQARILAFRKQEERIREAMYADMAEIERGLNQRLRAAAVISNGMAKVAQRRLQRGFDDWATRVADLRRQEDEQRNQLQRLLHAWSMARRKLALRRWKQQADRARKAERAAAVAAATSVQRVWRGRMALHRVARARLEQDRERKTALTLAYGLYRANWAKRAQRAAAAASAAAAAAAASPPVSKDASRKRIKSKAKKVRLPRRKTRRLRSRRSQRTLAAPDKESESEVDDDEDDEASSIATEVATMEAGDALKRVIKTLEEQEAAAAAAAARIELQEAQTLRSLMEELCEAVEFHVECEAALNHVLGGIQARYESALCLQHWTRGRLIRLEHIRRRQLAVRIQAAWRATWLARKYRDLVEKVTFLQAFARGCLARMHITRAHLSAIKVQSLVRRHLAKRMLQRLREEKRQMELRIARERVMAAKVQRRRNAAATKLQAQVRGFLGRAEWRATRRSALLIQTLVRGFLVRSRISHLHFKAREIQRTVRGAWGARKARARMEAVLRIEAFARLCLVRRMLAEMNAAATSIQCAYRSAKARYAAHLRRIIKQGKEEHFGCTELQRLWRGMKAREALALRRCALAETRLRDEYQTAYKSERLQEAWKRALKQKLEDERESREHAAERLSEHQDLLERRAQENAKAKNELAAWQRLAPEVDGAIDGSDIYYYHPGYGVSQWEPPEGFYSPSWDAQRKEYWRAPPDPNELRALNKGWMRIPSQDRRRVEFYNTWTGELSREMPHGFRETRFYGDCEREDGCGGHGRGSQNRRPESEIEDTFDDDDDLLREDELVGNVLLCSLCRVAQADRRCKVCGPRLPFCFQCFLTSHQYGTWRVHGTEAIKDADEDVELDRWEEPPKVLPEEDAAQCTECRFAEATRICDQCGDQMCEACFDELHAKGARVEHTWTEFHGFRWEEYFDEEMNRPQYFNTETKEFTDDCPLELMFGPDRHEYLQRVAKEKKAAAEAQRLAELTEEVEMLKEFREKSIAEDRALLQAQAEYNRAKSKTRKIAKFIAPSLVDDGPIGDASEASSQAAKPKKSKEQLEEEATLRAIRERRKSRRTQGFFRARPNKFARELSQDPEYLKKLLNGKPKAAGSSSAEETSLLRSPSMRRTASRRTVGGG